MCKPKTFAQLKAEAFKVGAFTDGSTGRRIEILYMRPVEQIIQSFMEGANSGKANFFPAISTPGHAGAHSTPVNAAERNMRQQPVGA